MIYCIETQAELHLFCLRFSGGKNGRNKSKKYLETKDKKYWKELIRLLPESWLQKRTVTMDYENILSMCGKGQRRFHKLNEWSGVDNPEKENFIKWARSLPYAKELIFLDETDEGDK